MAASLIQGVSRQARVNSQYSRRVCAETPSRADFGRPERQLRLSLQQRLKAKPNREPRRQSVRRLDAAWRPQLSHRSGRVQRLKVGFFPVRHSDNFTPVEGGPPM